MPKKDYLEGAINHFKHQEIKIIEVEEWGLIGEDAIYVKPFTLLEKSELFKDNNDLTVLIDIIIKKSETKDGEKMFDLESKIKMKKFVDPDIIGRVASQIMGTQSPTADLKKKLNSDNNLRFHFFLAEKLHKTIGEIMQMPVDEFDLWYAYYSVKADDEQKALNKAKMQGKRR
jgi:hypothetical protein